MNGPAERRLGRVSCTMYISPSRREFRDLEIEDLTGENAKTNEAKKNLKQMSKAEPFAMLNRRTAWCATAHCGLPGTLW